MSNSIKPKRRKIFHSTKWEEECKKNMKEEFNKRWIVHTRRKTWDLPGDFGIVTTDRAAELIQALTRKKDPKYIKHWR